MASSSFQCAVLVESTQSGRASTAAMTADMSFSWQTAESKPACASISLPSPACALLSPQGALALSWSNARQHRSEKHQAGGSLLRDDEASRHGPDRAMTECFGTTAESRW